MQELSLVQKVKNAKSQECTYNTTYVGDFALRQARTEHAKFDDLSRSIEKNGILNDPIGRPGKDGEVEIGDGAQRREAFYQACIRTLEAKHSDWDEDKIKERAGSTPFTVKVGNFSDKEIMLMQIVANVHRIDNNKKELAAQMGRMLACGECTRTQLAEMYNKSEPWVTQILNLKNLDPKLEDYLEKGTLGVSLACRLSKLPGDNQITLVADGLLDHDKKTEDRDAMLDTALKAYRKGKKVEKGQYILPMPKSCGWPKASERINAAVAAGNTEFAEGMLAAFGQDTESLKNHKLEWEAKQEANATESLSKSLAKKEEEIAELRNKLKLQKS